MACVQEFSLSALGTLDATTPILGPISISPCGAGWSLAGFALHRDLISDQIPTCLAPYIGGINLQLLCGVRIESA